MIFIKILFVTLLLFFSTGSFFVFAENKISPEEILQKVDEIRCPSEDYTTLVKVTSYRPGRSTRSAVYEVRAKGAQKTIVEILQPASERGQMLLMNDSYYWTFFPEVSQPVRILAQGRLLGDLFYGDIARTNLFGDYDVKILREEFSVDNKYYILELKAKNDSATYGQAYLWVEQKKFWPLKADFYSKSGRFLKTISFENYKMLGGRMRPSRIVFRDAIVENQYSVIEYSRFDLSPLPSKYFTKEYLKKKVF